MLRFRLPADVVHDAGGRSIFGINAYESLLAAFNEGASQIANLFRPK
jgi:hypothetical protein